MEGEHDGDGDDGHVDREAEVRQEGCASLAPLPSTSCPEAISEHPQKGGDWPVLFPRRELCLLRSLAQWSLASLLSFSKSSGPSGHAQNDLAVYVSDL